MWAIATWLTLALWVKLILFGAGKRLQNCLKNDITCKHEILAIADNNTEKQETSIILADCQIPIIAPEQISEYNFDAVALTTSKDEFLTAILKQLNSMGIPYNKIALLNPTGELSYFPKILPAKQLNTPEMPIYYDVTSISKYDSGTGIQREVNNLYRNLTKLHPNIVPSQMFLGNYITSRKYQTKIEGINYDYQEQQIDFSLGVRVLFPDMTWATDYRHLFTKLKKGNIRSYVIMYDIIPITQKHLYPLNYCIFQPYVDFILREADALICISRTVADDIANYYKATHATHEKGLPLYIFHEGFDIGNSQGYIRQELRDFIRKDKTLLSVGMNSPRKNHILTARVVYDIMQNNRAFDGNLLFIGRNIKEEQAQFESIIGKSVERILWVEDAKDNELCYAYENSRALVFATSSEGFGLPLVEAAHFGLPILASDIPIFREIAGNNILYFEPDNADSLRKTITSYWRRAAIAPNSKNIRLYTWEESAQEILAIMDGKVEPYRVLE